jgi:hypothetical protein
LARFARRRFAGPRRKRNLVWFGNPLINDSRTTTGTTETTIVTATEFNTMNNPTIRRILGRIQVSINTPSAVPSTTWAANIMLGLILEDESSTTPPAIETDAGWDRDWMWTAWRRVGTDLLTVEQTGGTETLSPYGGHTNRYDVDIDTRVMRKVERYEHLILCFGVSAITAGATVGQIGALRVLTQE